MKLKIIKVSIGLIILLIGAFGIYLLEKYKQDSLATIISIIIGFVLQKFLNLFIDLKDNSNWKTSQRKLERGKIINKNTLVRISFAYLFRIKIDGEYFLIKNSRGTNKFQPVGGVYKMQKEELKYLRQKFYSEDDNKIVMDESSNLDYRLNFKNKYLRKFIRRFNKTQNREKLEDLSREFKEELFENNILQIEEYKVLNYMYCGRHTTELKFSQHFQCYEILIADIVEVILDNKQEELFRKLKNIPSEKYCFATEEQIISLGVVTINKKYEEKISDHSKKILIKNTDQLEKKQKNKKNQNISINLI